MAANYERLELLGSGSYGKAWLVHCQKKNKKAVLKEIRLECLSEKEMSQALVEVKVLARCRHVNIISYHEAFVSSGCLQIVMEYADGGDIQKRITNQRGIHFDRELILDWFIQICFALKYLHSENILHRDLKPQNLFLMSDGIVKVGDFGIARVLQDTADHALTAIGTPYYISPEICQRQPYNFKSDMWSLGCVLYELCHLRVPFQAQNLPLLILKILDGQVDPLPSHCGPILEDLVSVLLRTDPSQRPSAEQVLNVPSLLPYVKTTYKKCLRHREKRQRERSASSQVQQLSQNKTPVTQRVQEKKALQSHRTYSVKNPLLRHLSTATPQFKAAPKRQRAVRSAEAVSVMKKQRKGSPPTLDLLRQVLQQPQPCYSRLHSDFEDEVSIRGDDPEDDVDEDADHGDLMDDVCDNVFDDVFDDESALKDKPDKVEHRLRNENSHSCKPRKSTSNPALKIEKVEFDGNIRKNKSVINYDGSYGANESTDVTGEDFQCDRVQQPDSDNLSVSEEYHLKSYPRKVRRASCHSVVDKEYIGRTRKVGNETPTRSKNPPPSPHVSRFHKGNEKKCETSLLLKYKGNSPILNNDKEHYRLENSETYFIEQPQQRTEDICSCGVQGLVHTKPCVMQVLYKAATLKLQGKNSATGVLSRFLKDHLGALLSRQLCKTVKASLQAGADYLELEASLEEQCKIYLPIVLQLLMINGK